MVRLFMLLAFGYLITIQGGEAVLLKAHVA